MKNLKRRPALSEITTHYKMNDASIGESIKDNRRLASFSDDDYHGFYAYLSTRYDYEIENWYKICPRDSWKFLFLETELKIRTLRKQVLELEAELW